MKARRLLLALLVAGSTSQLPGCGVTQWQRDQESQAQVHAALMDLQSPDMQRRIDKGARK